MTYTVNSSGQRLSCLPIWACPLCGVCVCRHSQMENFVLYFSSLSSFWERVLLYIVQSDFDLSALLLECQDYRCVPPHQVWTSWPFPWTPQLNTYIRTSQPGMAEQACNASLSVVIELRQEDQSSKTAGATCQYLLSQNLHWREAHLCLSSMSKTLG